MAMEFLIKCIFEHFMKWGRGISFIVIITHFDMLLLITYRLVIFLLTFSTLSVVKYVWHCIFFSFTIDTVTKIMDIVFKYFL